LASVEQLFCEFGLPQRLRSDNDAPFASAGITGLTALSVRSLKFGILRSGLRPASGSTTAATSGSIRRCCHGQGRTVQSRATATAPMPFGPKYDNEPPR